MTPDAIIVNQANFFTLDRVYALLPASVGFVGVRVRGQITGVERLQDPADPWSYVREDWAARYANANLDDLDSLKAIDKHNFSLTSDEVRSVQMRSRRTWWTGPLPNSGTLKFKLLSGKSRRFILIGKQDRQAAVEFFAHAGIDVQCL